MSDKYTYTPAKAAEICELLSLGQPLTKICRFPGMPNLKTVYRWLEKKRRFREMFALARLDQADTYADEIVEIADKAEGDLLPEEVDENGKVKPRRVDWENIQRSKLRVDARKWVAAHLKPQKYGELVRQELTGKGGAPLPAGPTYIISKDEAKKLEAELDDEV